MTKVFFSAAASEAPRLTAVVVFPTPPFWLATAITRAKFLPRKENGEMYQKNFPKRNMFHVKRPRLAVKNTKRSALPY